jgi:hypothetical protein
MKVSAREEALAKELYAHDMGVHQGEAVSWDRQITYVQDSYRRQAAKIVSTRWFKREIEKAKALDKENSDNRVS